jgi:signal transduction histidine kinase
MKVSSDVSPFGHGELTFQSFLESGNRSGDAHRDDLLGHESAVADYEDRMHAVRSGLSAVAGAVHVLTGSDMDLPPTGRQRIRDMLVAEIERLQRLVAPGFAADSGRRADLDLDEVIEHVALTRELAGHHVVWCPTGHRVAARRDELIEVLNILLVNAFRHAAGTPTRVEVSADEGVIRISVSDDGPGVSPELRESIFVRGARRPDSPGEGIGLSMACDLVSDLGGDLALDQAVDHGARFQVTLPAGALGGAA